MIKVLLADDNKLSLSHLMELVNWQADGFEIAACTENGVDALKAYHRFHPELVITDVRMPGMTGIELAREIKNEAPETVIIFLSDYEEFAYIKSAMELGVFDYILKHENIKDKLNEKLTLAKKILKQRSQIIKFSEEGWLLSFLSNLEHINGDVLHEQAKDIFPDQYDFFLIEQDFYLPPISNQLQIYTQEANDQYVKNICYMHFKIAVAMVKLAKYQYLLMMHHEKNKNSIVYKIKEKLQEKLNASFSILVISENTTVTEGLALYHGSKKLMEQKYFYPMSVVLNRSLLHPADNSKKQYLDIQKFKYNLLKNRIQELCEQMDTAYLEIIKRKDSSGLFDFIKILLDFLLPFHQKVMDYKKGGSFILYEEYNTDNWYSSDDTFYWLKQKYMQLAQIWQNNSLFSYSPQVQAAIKYIHNHYMNSDISAEKVAEQAGLSVNRLNTLMKEETGDTVWKLLTKVRVEKAKQLLDSAKDSISDIYPMVGYTTLSYFSKIFKKTSGVSPQKYRRIKNDIQKAEI